MKINNARKYMLYFIHITSLTHVIQYLHPSISHNFFNFNE